MHARERSRSRSPVAGDNGLAAVTSPDVGPCQASVASAPGSSAGDACAGAAGCNGCGQACPSGCPAGCQTSCQPSGGCMAGCMPCCCGGCGCCGSCPGCGCLGCGCPTMSAMNPMAALMQQQQIAMMMSPMAGMMQMNPMASMMQMNPMAMGMMPGATGQMAAPVDPNALAFAGQEELPEEEEEDPYPPGASPNINHPHYRPPDMEVVPGLTDRRFVGVMYLWFEDKGFGFIECPDITKKFGQDAFLHRTQRKNFKRGQYVSFSVYLNYRGKPQATELRKAEKPKPEEKT
ncbi:unnamed protein product [Symbiodinium sp. CCMP2456]|nr:unnamed protein product [Symbiodinium sp. CCMP2456]